MPWLFAIILAVLGSAFGGVSAAALGFVLGGVGGFVFGAWIDANRRMHALEAELAVMRGHVTDLEARAASPTPDPGPTLEPAPRAAAPAPVTPAADAREAPIEWRDPAPTTADPASPARDAQADRAMFDPFDTTPAWTVPEAPSPRPAATDADASATANARATTGPARYGATAPINPAGESRLDDGGASAAPGAARPASAYRASERMPPSTPDFGERFGHTLRRWFTEGNVPVKIGVVVFLFGIGAALKYGVDQGWFSMPIEYRLIGVAVAALVGLAIGWRERTRRRPFSLAIQGGAIGVLLLTVFASFGMYHVIEPMPAFALIVVLVAGASLLAVLQNAPVLAALGFFGGYLAPVIIRTGSNDHVALFSYYAVLNTAVFAIATVKSWRALNLIGFAFTFVVGLAWGAQYYEPRHFATVEPFLVLFFLFYVGIAVLYALRQPGERRGLVDGSITFGTPLLAFPLQAAMLRDEPLLLAYSALAVAALYGALAWWLIRRRGVVVLGQVFAVLAIGFATLSVPLALSARMTATTWAIEGAALVWLGLRQQRLLPRISGLLLQIAAAMAYLAGVSKHGYAFETGEVLVLNGHFLSLALIAVAGFATAWLYDRAKSERLYVWVPFVWAWFWWTMAGVREIDVHASVLDRETSLLLFVSFTAALAALLRRALRWPPLGTMVIATAFAGLPIAIALIAQFQHPFGTYAHWAWLAWLAAMLDGLRRLREPPQRGSGWAHALVLVTVAAVAGFEGGWRVGTTPDVGSAWAIVVALLPTAVLLWGTRRAQALFAWPMADRYDDYRARFELPATLALAFAWLGTQVHDGASAPLQFVPLLNPLELAQVIGLVFALRVAASDRSGADAMRLVAPFAALLQLTMMTLRGVHHLYDLPWSPALLDSRIAQTALTVVWATVGVAAWIYGSKRLQRGIWRAGALIIGLVLLKLMLVDRQYIGNLPGIVSFLAVGLLMIVVGYFAPSPPREKSEAA